MDTFWPQKNNPRYISACLAGNLFTWLVPFILKIKWCSTFVTRVVGSILEDSMTKSLKTSKSKSEKLSMLLPFHKAILFSKKLSSSSKCLNFLSATILLNSEPQIWPFSSKTTHKSWSKLNSKSLETSHYVSDNKQTKDQTPDFLQSLTKSSTLLQGNLLADNKTYKAVLACIMHVTW
jgi:hypothetical protein